MQSLLFYSSPQSIALFSSPKALLAMNKEMYKCRIAYLILPPKKTMDNDLKDTKCRRNIVFTLSDSPCVMHQSEDIWIYGLLFWHWPDPLILHIHWSWQELIFQGTSAFKNQPVGLKKRECQIRKNQIVMKNMLNFPSINWEGNPLPSKKIERKKW